MGSLKYEYVYLNPSDDGLTLGSGFTTMTVTIKR